MNILITGAASGIGRAAAELFLSRGHTVFGVDLTETPTRENYRGFVSDVTDEDSLASLRDALSEGGVAIDVILCAAGIHRMVSLAESDFTVMRQLVDVNLTGTMLVNRVFHSLLAPKGRIIIITSEVAGFAPMPFNGLYSVTKTALDSYAQALRQELNLIGQRVVTLRPGAVETPLSRRSVTDTQALSESTVLYKKQAGRFSRIAARFMGTPIPPERPAALIYRAATVRRPRLTYKIHRNPGLVLLSLLPKRLQCAVIKLLLGIGGV